MISGVGTICEICGKKKKLAGRDLFLPLTTIESQDLGHRKKIKNQEEIQIFQEQSKMLQEEIKSISKINPKFSRKKSREEEEAQAASYFCR